MKYMKLCIFLLISGFFLNAHAQNCPSWNESTGFHILNAIDTAHETGWIKFHAFSDEFEGSTINGNKWHVNNTPTCQEKYDAVDLPQSVSQSNGKIHVSLTKLATPVPCTAEDTIERYYTWSKGYFKSVYPLHYGYLEALITFPNFEKFRSAFWLFSAYGDTSNPNHWYDEIDGYEIDLRDQDNHFTHSIYYHRKNPFLYKTDRHFIDTLNESHLGKTYLMGIEWLPSEINWYINGDCVFSQKFTTSTDLIDLDGRSPTEFTCINLPDIHAIKLWFSTGIFKAPADQFDGTLYDVDYIHMYKLQPGDSVYHPAFFDMSDAKLFKVNGKLTLGGEGYSAFIVPANSKKNTFWATNEIVLDKGFETAPGAKFTARVIRDHPDLYNLSILEPTE